MFILFSAAIADTENQKCNVVPENTNDLLTFEFWSSKPITHSRNLTIKNRLGQRILQLNYKLQFFYGGSHDGTGKYLADVTVVPTSVYVAWGYKLNAKAEISAMCNVGAYKEPIAAAHVTLHFKLKALNLVEERVGFDIRGDGTFDYEINSEVA